MSPGSKWAWTQSSSPTSCSRSSASTWRALSGGTPGTEGAVSTKVREYWVVK